MGRKMYSKIKQHKWTDTLRGGLRDYRPQHPLQCFYTQEGPKSYQVTLPGEGVPWRQHSNLILHGPDRGKLDQPNTGESDEEDVSTQI